MGATDREIFEDLVMGLKDIADARGKDAISLREALEAVSQGTMYGEEERFRRAVKELEKRGAGVHPYAIDEILTDGRMSAVEGHQIVSGIREGMRVWKVVKVGEEGAKESAPAQTPAVGGEEEVLLRSYASQVTLKEIAKLLGWQPNLLGSYLGCLWGKGEELPIGTELRDRIVANLDQVEKERIAQVRAETRAAKDFLGTLPKSPITRHAGRDAAVERAHGRAQERSRQPRHSPLWGDSRAEATVLLEGGASGRSGIEGFWR